jgi:hypothetical protein
MKNGLIIVIIIFWSSLTLLAQTPVFNQQVPSSGQMTCYVIKPLSVSPLSTDDYINWPSIPVGSQYIISHNNPDADWRSIFTFKGEPGKTITISVTKQTEVDNVEISYQLKGTAMQFDQNPGLLIFDGNGMINRDLSNSGVYYVHIIYDWVWAKVGATPGVREFTQVISAQYYNL